MARPPTRHPAGPIFSTATVRSKTGTKVVLLIVPGPQIYLEPCGKIIRSLRKRTWTPRILTSDPANRSFVLKGIFTPRGSYVALVTNAKGGAVSVSPAGGLS